MVYYEVLTQHALRSYNKLDWFHFNSFWPCLMHWWRPLDQIISIHGDTAKISENEIGSLVLPSMRVVPLYLMAHNGNPRVCSRENGHPFKICYFWQTADICVGNCWEVESVNQSPVYHYSRTLYLQIYYRRFWATFVFYTVPDIMKWFEMFFSDVKVLVARCPHIQTLDLR